MRDYRIKDYTKLTPPELLSELQTVIEHLVSKHEEIAFIKSQEALDKLYSGRVQRIQLEGERDGYTEIKWLILRCLDERASLPKPSESS